MRKINIVRPLIFVFFVQILWIGCSQNSKYPHLEETIAKAGNVEITESDFNEYYIKHLIRTGKNDTKSERYTFLEKLLDQMILADEAIEKGILNDDFSQAFLTLQKKKAYRDFYFLDAMNEQAVEVSESEIRTAYQKKNEKIYARQLYFNDPSQADFYYRRLQRGEDFLELANELYHTEKFDSTAGYMGEMGYFSVDDAFAEVAFSTPVDSFSAPIRSKWGLHIVKVEHKVSSPLISEDQFQLNKKGVESQVRLRKRRLKGNGFVLEEMQQTNPQLNTSLIQSLQNTLRDIHRGAMVKQNISDSPDKIKFGNEEVSRILDQFSPEDVIATYTFDGETKTLFMKDFAEWLPDLLPSEVLNRIGASIGRVLRNEVFFEKGVNMGYASDPRIQHDLELRSRFYAADRFMDQLIFSERDSAKVDEEAFEAFLKSKSKTQWTFAAAVKAFSSMESAIKEQQKLKNFRFDQLTEYGFVEENMVISPKHNLFRILKDAPINTLSIGIDGKNQIYLVYVASRNQEKILPDMDEYRNLFVTFTQVNEYVSTLKNEAKIFVDSTRFEEMYVLK